MTDILTEIIACKQIEIELQKAAISKEMLINNCNEPMPRISMRASLASSPYGIISEFKRRSPSKGWIKEDAQADTIPPAYEAAGASALSILTDEKYFGGSLKDIRSARPHVQLPILRKDFIIDEYQLYQARIVGADAILLIAAALKKEQCKALALKAHELELEVLLEIHNEQELEYIDRTLTWWESTTGIWEASTQRWKTLSVWRKNYPKKCSGSLKAASPAPKQSNNSGLPASEAS